MLLWTLDPAERDASLANEATKKMTSNNWVLAEIACTRPALDLFKAKQAYQARYKSSLEEDVAYHTSGDFRKVKELIMYLLLISRYKKSCMLLHNIRRLTPLFDVISSSLKIFQNL